MSGLVGLAYNRAATGREITKIDDLWDPAFKGKVSLFSDAQTALGMIMLSQGGSAGEPHHRVGAEGGRSGQGAQGPGPDPPVHRQRLLRRPCRRECGRCPSLFGRRGAVAGRQPRPAVRGSGVGRDDVRRHHGDPVHHAEPEGGRGVDQLRLRPAQLRQARRVRPVRSGAVGHDRGAQQDRPGAGQQPADQPAAGGAGQGRRVGRCSPTSRSRSTTPPSPRSPAHSRWPA